MTEKNVNINNIVAIYIRNESIYDEYHYTEIKKIKWIIFPVWFKRIKLNKWCTKYHNWDKRYFDTVQEVIAYEKCRDIDLRYDEEKKQFILKPYIHITYTDKSHDTILFETNEEKNILFKELSEKISLLKITHK